MPQTASDREIRTGDRTVLADTGAGTIDNGGYAGGRFLDSLRAYGAAPGDVTDVVFTHLHFDPFRAI